MTAKRTTSSLQFLVVFLSSRGASLVKQMLNFTGAERAQCAF